MRDRKDGIWIQRILCQTANSYGLAGAAGWTTDFPKIDTWIISLIPLDQSTAITCTVLVQRIATSHTSIKMILSDQQINNIECSIGIDWPSFLRCSVISAGDHLLDAFDELR